MGCLLAMCKALAPNALLQKNTFICIAKPEVSDSRKAIKVSHYVALAGLELTDLVQSTK